MSRLWVRAVLSLALLTAVAGGAAAGVAGAASVESALEGALAPSAAPALLGPITEAGRKGWACKPEQAAAARTAHDAELPDASAP
jgi:hypothetical protein